jgi:hypothetical protein
MCLSTPVLSLVLNSRPSAPDAEFELGELAGSITNLLLLAKPFFKFHSHKSTHLHLALGLLRICTAM